MKRSSEQRRKTRALALNVCLCGLVAVIAPLNACLTGSSVQEIDCNQTDEGCDDLPDPEPSDPSPDSLPDGEATPDTSPDMDPTADPPDPLECDPPCLENEECVDNACRPTENANNEDCLDLDIPDPEGIDENCDGIDGDITRSVFVTEFGSDANEGEQNTPMRSIQAAIQRVVQDENKDTILVSPGLFEGPIRIVEGVHIYGGYDFNWQRDLSIRPTIRGGNPVVIADGLEEAATLENVALEADRRAETQENNYTVYVKNTLNLSLARLSITAGDGGDGLAGNDGEGGSSGTDGANGRNGCEDGLQVLGVGCDDCSRPGAGNGGGSMCGQTGGAGGRPGHPDNGSSENGINGVGASGGSGGGRGAGGRDGGNANPGTGGATGQQGVSGAPFGMNSDGHWFAFDGTDGGAGEVGGGGGGGGGGGDGNSNCDSWGGGGGGGGGGGCGGTGGTAGAGGGGSFGIYLFNSNVVIERCTIFAGTGGSGGDGGRGGSGGSGGRPGRGGDGEDDSGKGGNGGSGGRGGAGGAGGGGAGGLSFGIYSNLPFETTPMDCEITPGLGGTGGFGGTANGSEGAAGEIFPSMEGEGGG